MLAQKGSVPKKGPNLSHMEFLSVLGGDILKSCANTKFEAERLKIAPFRTDRTFLDPNCPTFTRPFWDRIWNLRHYHPVDNITKEKPAKFQIKWTAGSKVLRLCNFGAPKRVKTPKGPKSGLYGVWNFPIFQVEIRRNHGHGPNFKRNWLKILHLGPSKLSVPKMHLVPNPYFRTEIGNSDDAGPEISSRQPRLPSFKSDRHPVPKLWAWVFWSQKRGNAQNPLCHAHIPNFISAFVAVEAPTESWKFGPNSPSRSLVRTQRNLGPIFQRAAQKRELEPTNNKLMTWVHGNIVSAKFTQKKIGVRPSVSLAKHPFETNALFFLIVLVIFWMLRRSVLWIRKRKAPEKLPVSCGNG